MGASRTLNCPAGSASGADWTQKYPAIAQAIAGLPAQDAYLDGELCGVLPDGRTASNLIQNATDGGQGSLVYFVFDLLFLDGEDIRDLSLVDRKARLEAFLVGAPESLPYNDHQIGQGAAFHRLACERCLEGIASIRSRSPGCLSPLRHPWWSFRLTPGAIAGALGAPGDGR